jgi:hypothetical protein
VRLLVAAIVATAAPAAADPPLTPITSRDYKIDLYDGVALGNSAVIAMGGASVANAIGSSGTLVNPSAPAVRQTTDTDRWNWDYHLDYLNASVSRDYSNSGLTNLQGGGATMATGGLAGRLHNNAAAVTISLQTVPLSGATAMLPGGGTADIDATTLRGRFAIARWFDSRDIAAGLAIAVGQLDIKPACATAGCGSLFQIQGGGLEAGATYIPRWQSWRIGAAATSVIVGGNVSAGSCPDPNNCDGLTLPQEVHVPWRASIGGAYRWAESEWNQLVGGDFRDEPSVTVTADLLVTGSSPNAYGLDAFGRNELERSGSHTSWSLRGGAEYEWLPGRLRVRGGSYWEPGRFDGVSGRLHGTFGIEVRVFEFQAWGRRRGRITLTGDLATGYVNGGLSAGFWH